MNTTFSIKRFYKLIRLNFSIHKKSFLLQLAAFTALAFVVTGVVLANANSQSLQFEWISVFYALIFLFTGNYLASRSFTYFHRTKRAVDILLPASKFEKFMMPTLFTGIIFLLLFSIYYWLLARLTTFFWMPIYGFSVNDYPLITNATKDIVFVALIVYLCVHPLFLIGSLSFKKNSFFLTGLLLFLMLLAVFYYGYTLGNLLFDSKKLGQIKIDGNDVKKTGAWIFAIVLNIVFSIAAFFKLKEKEV